jgi:hypothetical protein
MTQITLDNAQTQIVLQAHDPVRVCSADGTVLGTLAPLSNASDVAPVSSDEIDAAKCALDSPGPWRTTKEVLERLGSSESRSK